MRAAPKKILVLRFSSLGDIVMATAMIRCLRTQFPDARIDFLVRSDFQDLIRFNPHLTHAWGLPRHSGWRGLRGLLRDINAVDYDLVYDAHRSLRTRLLMPWVRSKHKAYFSKQYLRRALLMTFKLPLVSKRRFLERFVDPLAPWGVLYDGAGPEFHVDDASESSALAKTGLVADGTQRVAIVPSAQWNGKRWPPERFRELIEKLLAKTAYQLVVFGGPSDTFCQELTRGLDPTRVINTQGKLGLLESGALLKHCRFTIANDTGLMHLADALGVPSILIFGPTSGEMGCLPFHPKSRIVENTLWCRPCSKNGQAPCIRSRRWCLDLTTSDRVLAEALALGQETT
ncbi:glycosyltransferase family 9 protein [bacterium]|nr:glycosyltransferase family 9 protein [bacterium]